MRSDYKYFTTKTRFLTYICVCVCVEGEVEREDEYFL